MNSRVRRTSIAAAALVLACCAVPNSDAIRAALEGGKPKKALKLARSDGRSLDYLATEILRRGAGDEEMSEEALAAISRARTRLKPLLREIAAGDGDPVVVAEAQSLLFKMDDRSHEDDLVEALDSDLGLVRAAAVEALLTMQQSRNFHERYILDNEPEVRSALVAHLATAGLPWSQDLLLSAARKDPEPSVRIAAIRALDPLEEQNRDVLKDALKSSDRALRIAAATCLGKEASSMELTWTAHLAALPATEEGIHFASSLLATDKGKEKAAQYLQEALHDESPTIRLATLIVLTSAGSGIDGLEELASDPSAQVRVAWCRLTRKLGTSKAKKRVEILEAIAAGEDAGQDALLALAEEKGGYEKVRSRVWWLLRDGPPDVQRYILVHAIRPFGDPSLAIWGMKAKEGEVRLHAAASWLMRD
jgi:HEAT repeat protein